MLNLTHRNVIEARRFSRHVDANTLLIYDDTRTDVAARIGRMLAAAL